jgi:simple sugar transport system permease protein
VLRLGRRASRHIAFGVVAVLVIVTTLMLGVAGFDVGRALDALVSGALGSWDALTSSTCVRATPLILTGLAVSVAFKAGVFNIGAEGQFLVGAAAATTLALALRDWPSPLLIAGELTAGAAAGAVWAWIAS